MLINFRIKNVRSFYEEAVLSMQPVEQVSNDDENLEAFNTFKIPNEDGRLLKSAVIFGANASGKSNIFRAFSYIKNAIRSSANTKNTNEESNIIERNPFFVFEEDGKKTPSEYEIEFISNSVYYRYAFSILQKKVAEEWLEKKLDDGKFDRLFYRQYNEIKFSNQKDEIVKSIMNLEEIELFLSKWKSFTLSISPDLKNVIDWINRVRIVSIRSENPLAMYADEKYKRQALEIVQKADIGIEDFNLVKRKLHELKDDELGEDDFKEIIGAIRGREFGQLHQEGKILYSVDIETQSTVYNKNQEEVSKKTIMLFEDVNFHSEGTKRLFQYLGDILYALDKGYIILIDEIDASLHFLVVEYLLQMFNSIDKNPNNAQLICSAHNLKLMDKNLRRDQIYFISKNRYGKSYLDSLVDYSEVETKHLLSKQYLAGFFTDLPNLNR